MIHPEQEEVEEVFVSKRSMSVLERSGCEVEFEQEDVESLKEEVEVQVLVVRSRSHVEVQEQFVGMPREEIHCTGRAGSPPEGRCETSTQIPPIPPTLAQGSTRRDDCACDSILVEEGGLEGRSGQVLGI